MKRKNVFWAMLACVAMVGLMASCNKEDANGTNVSDVSDYPTLIVGKWNLVHISGSYNGVSYGPTNVTDSAYALTMEFSADGNYTFTSSGDYHYDNYSVTTRYWIEGSSIFYYSWDEDYNVTSDVESMLISYLDHQKLILHGEFHDEEDDIIQNSEFHRMTE